MNKGKISVPCENPDSYIHFLAFLKIRFRIPYRTVHSIGRGLSGYIMIGEMHFTQIRRRTLEIMTCTGDTNFNDEPMLLVMVDPSGLTISKKGDHTEEG